MISYLKTFRQDEDGAVTVDWVVLTAAVVGLGVSAYATVSDATDSLTGNTDTTLSEFTVGNVSIAE